MDLSTEFINKGMKTIDKSFQRSVDKGKIRAEDKTAILSRMKSLTDVRKAKKTDLAIGPIFRHLELKNKFLRC